MKGFFRVSELDELKRVGGKGFGNGVVGLWRLGAGV